MNIDWGKDVVRNVAVSAAMGMLGFASHQVFEAAGQRKTLEAHSEQIAKLSDEVEKVDIGIARIEGKLDVINQKIDDDRDHNRSTLADRH